MPTWRERVVPLRHPWTWVASAFALLVAGGVFISVATNPAFQWPVVAQYMLDEQILGGLARTLELTLAAMAMGLVLGTALAVMRLSRNLLLSTLSWLYIWFFRSVPVLVQLIFWYNFGALYPKIVLRVPFGPVLYSASTNAVITPLTAALAGLGLAQAAYTAEVIRAGIRFGAARADAGGDGARHAARDDLRAHRLSAGDARDHSACRQRGDLDGEEHLTGQRHRAGRAALHGAAHLRAHIRDDPAADRCVAVVSDHRVDTVGRAAFPGALLPAPHMSEPMVRIRGLTQALRRTRGAARYRPRCARGVGDVHHRAVGFRQEHVAVLHQPPGAHRRRQGVGGRRACRLP